MNLKLFSFLFGTALLLYYLSIAFFIKGVFLTKKTLTNKSVPTSNSFKNPDKKVILLLVDALREDFVEMDEIRVPKRYLDR